ncbi:MAG: HEAT repeat domain-containing protein [Oscillatoriaceae cyanobacterium Prado104]|nr:HEAT repeat domain-containing protein [Oscillatoriaceae cyanobacterium Prado104]
MAQLSHSLENLEEIGKDNPLAISAVVKLMASSQQEHTYWMLADYLGKIATNKSEAISALVNLIGSSQNETTQLKAATSLGKIEKNNSVAIETLVNLIRNRPISRIWLQAVHSLAEIGKDNQSAIETLSETLVKLISGSENHNDLHRNAFFILRKIGKYNPTAIIESLVEIMNNTHNELKLRSSLSCLGDIGKGNQVAIAALVQLIGNSGNEDTRRQAADSLGAIDQDNPVAISVLVELINTSQDESIQWQAADSLGKISKDNPVAISALAELINTSQDEFIRWQAADSLGKIDKNNPVAIQVFVKLIKTSKDKNLIPICVKSLESISKDNSEVIATLVELIRNSGDKYIRMQVQDSLGKIMKGKHFTTAVSGLKDCLTSEVYENDLDLYKDCFEIIWNCAQNLPYPIFYQAWHHQLTTPHPEVPETTGVGSTPFTQSLNLADLPKILEARLAETQLIDSVQLICIDTSKFIDPNNPAPDIYEQFLDQNCPERLNGEPETLSQLKSYWNRLRRHSHKPPILIFYEHPTSATAQALSPTFLEALTRFDGTICLILLQTVANWVKRVHLES